MTSVAQSLSIAEEDPLIRALPPATDYLTYLTLLEYQLTPARLPTLHKLLQDEVLTTNIGWDLVKLLLPMLPESTECLQDIACLGNPREVILRVCDALMQLHPTDHEDEIESVDSQFQAGEDNRKDTHTQSEKVREEPIPSRFLATSLQAALEAYTSMPTNETTIAFLEFLRDVSPSKRPAPPPRVPSESSVLRLSEASAPDPEAEISSPSLSGSEEPLLIRRFLQFGLIELLKSYVLSCSGPVDPGMSWTVRLQEKLHPKTKMPGTASPTNVYLNTKLLGERDTIIAKITALSRDFGLDDKQLLEVVLRPPADQPPPLDFEDIPKQVDDIPLERHGSLVLLAARAAVAELFSSGRPPHIPIFPDLASVFANFVGGFHSIDEVAFEKPQVLLDSLLTLTVLSMQSPIATPSSEAEFMDFILSVTACTVRQSYGTVRKIPGVIIHSNSSEIARFKVIRKVLEDDHLQPIKERAIDWLKNEILEASSKVSNSNTSIFLNPHYFSVGFPLLFSSAMLDLDLSSDIVASWVRFTQTLSPALHAALNFYYVLISSPSLRSQLQLEKTYIYLRHRFLEPLKSICHAFTADQPANGGDGVVENAVGEDIFNTGMARSVQLILHSVEQVEDVVREAFVLGDTELQEPSADDIARVDAIRKETAVFNEKY
ncbi:hypothetical protein ARAM_001412 [Aspergillus rambellii]|uniref:DUF1760-domain-containing protein n=1 Tax=Aspergillus rambellii TaxID=308745 RepID=A0A0F8UHJ8_9EURO|nr:hypothetical protein ARAM_001412 [Aspergillus rambellii]